MQNCQPVAEMLANKNVEEAFVELSSGCKILALRDISSSLTGPGGGRALVRAHPLGSETVDATDAQVAAIAFWWNSLQQEIYHPKNLEHRSIPSAYPGLAGSVFASSSSATSSARRLLFLKSSIAERSAKFGINALDSNTHPVFGDVSFVINQTDMASRSYVWPSPQKTGSRINSRVIGQT